MRSPGFNLNEVWDNASERERRGMVEELIEAVTIYADRLEATVTGAPPLLVRLDEVGLRDPDRGPVVSKGDLNSGISRLRRVSLSEFNLFRARFRGLLVSADVV